METRTTTKTTNFKIQKITSHVFLIHLGLFESCCIEKINWLINWLIDAQSSGIVMSIASSCFQFLYLLVGAWLALWAPVCRPIGWFGSVIRLLFAPAVGLLADFSCCWWNNNLINNSCFITLLVQIHLWNLLKCNLFSQLSVYNLMKQTFLLSVRYGFFFQLFRLLEPSDVSC